MAKQIVTIHIDSDIDDSTLLDLALDFGRFVGEQTSEECVVDEDETSVVS